LAWHPIVGWWAMTDKDPLILDFRNGGVPEGMDLGEYYVTGLDDETADWDGIDLEEMFDLPPVLPPVRLPDETELAAQARRSALLADLRALADEVRATTVQAGAVNPVFLWLAEEAELVERDGEDLAPGEDAGWLDDLADDSDALDAWEDTFAAVLDTTLEAADDSGSAVAHDLDLEGHGPALVMMLFLSRRDGVRAPHGGVGGGADRGLNGENHGPFGQRISMIPRGQWVYGLSQAGSNAVGAVTADGGRREDGVRAP
jgi:hypothetical protein